MNKLDNNETNSRVDWYPMRRRGLGARTEANFEGLSWDPNLIPYASQLEINVPAILHLLQGIDSQRALKLISFGSSQPNDVINVGDVSNGEAVATSVVTEELEPESPDLVIPEFSDDPYQIAIDFNGIAEFVKTNFPEEEFATQLAREVEQDFIAAAIDMVMANFFLRMQDDALLGGGSLIVEFYMSVIDKLISLMIILGAVLGTSILILSHSEFIEDIPRIILTEVPAMAFIIISGFNAMLNVASLLAERQKSDQTSDQPLSTILRGLAAHGEHLKEELSQHQYLSFIAPTQFIQTVTMQKWILRLSSKNTFFRAQPEE